MSTSTTKKKRTGSRGYDLPPPDIKRSRRDDRYYGNDEKEEAPGYYGPSSRREDDDRNGDWKCLECKTWNFPEEFRCARCGAYYDQEPRPGYHYQEHHHAREYPRSGAAANNNWNEGTSQRRRHDSMDDREGQEGRCYYQPETEESEHVLHDHQELDEFGRVKQAPKGAEEPREWPPCFEENGSAFHFDSRSAMFYEAESDFFYDPKTKLYYGNKKRAYFRYDAAKNPPFLEVQKVATGSDGSNTVTTDPEPVLAARPVSSDSGTSKQSISIKLKTKSLKTKKPKSSDKAGGAEQTAAATATATTGTSVPTTVAQKKHAADIEKWSERQRERDDNDEKKQQKQEADSVRRTAKGEPICVLCRRKFANLEKLRYHEAVSKLHKENLMKQAAAAKKETESSKDDERGQSLSYVDRAQQRRNLYGSEVASSHSVPALPSSTASTGSTSSVAPAQSAAAPTIHEPLGETNVGHQMLQKLGWKGGSSSLGKNGNNGSAPPHAIVQDWDRIESIAAAQQQQQGRHSNRRVGGVGSAQNS